MIILKKRKRKESISEEIGQWRSRGRLIEAWAKSERQCHHKCKIMEFYSLNINFSVGVIIYKEKVTYAGQQTYLNAQMNQMCTSYWYLFLCNQRNVEARTGISKTWSNTGFRNLKKVLVIGLLECDCGGSGENGLLCLMWRSENSWKEAHRNVGCRTPVGLKRLQTSPDRAILHWLVWLHIQRRHCFSQCTMIRQLLSFIRFKWSFSNVLTSLVAKRSFAATHSVWAKKMPDRPPPVNEDEFTETYLKGSGPGGQKIVSYIYCQATWLILHITLPKYHHKKNVLIRTGKEQNLVCSAIEAHPVWPCP